MSLIFTFPVYSKIKIAIIDTGFCPDHQDVSNIHFEKSYDATNSLLKLTCPTNYLKLPRFHGENVLNTFIADLKTTEPIEIYPIVVFDHNGKQEKKFWDKAISHINYLIPDLIISAVGLKADQFEYSKSVNSIWFLSAPRISPYIKKSDNIYPQKFYSKPNVFLFGSYFEGNIIDDGQLYLENISLFEKDSNKDFNGSSFAVGKISAKILNNCSISNLAILNECIKKHKVKIAENIFEFN